MVALLALLLAQPATLNLNQTPIESRQDGARLSRFRQYAVDCRTNMTCVVDGGVLLLSSSGGSGGSGAPVDAGYVIWSSAASTGSSNERVLTAGTNVTLDTSTPGQLVVNASGGGGGGSVNTASGVASFDGGSLDALTTVTAAWATPSSVILCRPSGEEASVEGLQTTVTSQGSGSFVVRSEPRNGTHWGSLPFVCIGN
jgi:hypothetical protein